MIRNARLFVETEGATLVRTAIDMAVRSGKPSLVTGDPGFGKTTALRHVGAEFGAVYCQVNQNTKDVTGMYLMLLKAYGQMQEGRYKRDFGEQIYDYLRRRYLENAADEYALSPRPGPLIFDEYQNADLTTLRELLAVCETCAVPLVLSGNKERLARSERRVRYEREQITSRIFWRAEMPRPRENDCRKIAERALPGFTDSRWLDALARYGAETSFRQLDHALDFAHELGRGKDRIETNDIKTALRALGAPAKLTYPTKGEALA